MDFFHNSQNVREFGETAITIFSNVWEYVSNFRRIKSSMQIWKKSAKKRRHLFFASGGQREGAGGWQMSGKQGGGQPRTRVLLRKGGGTESIPDLSPRVPISFRQVQKYFQIVSENPGIFKTHSVN